MLPCRFAIFAAAIAIGVAAIPSAAGGPLSDPMSFLVWWDSAGTASAAITIVHLFAIAGFAYVAVVAALVAVADIFRLGALRHTVLRAARPHLQRTLTAGAFVAVSAAAPAIANESSSSSPTSDRPHPRSQRSCCTTWALSLSPRPPFHSSRPTPTQPRRQQIPWRRRPPIAGRSSQATTSG